ncbi:MAG: type II secretion system inner membrane protein GspF [Bdellovibrionales bacterium]
MPIFEYRGLNKKGTTVRGVVDSENIRTARVRLKKDGIFVTDIKDKKRVAVKKSSGPSALTRKSVPVKDLALMTRQLATLIKASIPLVDALNAVAEQTENPALSEAVADCKNQVNEGAPLHKSLSKYPQIFSKIYISMAEAGEASGSLETILMRLAEFLEAAADLRARLSSALTYPIIMLVVVLGVMIGLFTFVIPKIVTIFSSFPELTLPWYTQVVIYISDIFVGYWYLILGFMFISFILFSTWKRTPSGAAQWDAISLKLPVFGPVIRMVAVARFTRTLSTLLVGGVPMLQALEIVKNVVDNDVIARAIENARSNISEGESIAGPLKKSEQFPPLVIHMVNIGEKTGELENMLTQVSNAYDFQVKTKIEAMTSLINPAITIMMGFIIFIVVISVVIPMMDLTQGGF